MLTPLEKRSAFASNVLDERDPEYKEIAKLGTWWSDNMVRQWWNYAFHGWYGDEHKGR